MPIYRHAGRTFLSEGKALAEAPLRIGDEITRAETSEAPFMRHCVAVSHAGEVSWLFVGKHVPVSDPYHIGTMVAS